MAKARKEASVTITEGEAVAAIAATLEALDDKKAVERVTQSVGALFGFYVESNS